MGTGIEKQGSAIVHDASFRRWDSAKNFLREIGSNDASINPT